MSAKNLKGFLCSLSNERRADCQDRLKAEGFDCCSEQSSAAKCQANSPYALAEIIKGIQLGSLGIRRAR